MKVYQEIEGNPFHNLIDLNCSNSLNNHVLSFLYINVLSIRDLSKNVLLLTIVILNRHLI